MTSFFAFCEEQAIPFLNVTNIDVTRYIAWVGERGTVAADSLQPYLSAINKFIIDHGKPSVALGPLVSGVRAGLANCHEDLDPTPERLYFISFIPRDNISLMKKRDGRVMD
jgi:hypothetical protein